ncbi:MAG TPA: methionyl-tRNA formyltransferase [Candidatus Limnocylindrales bacterium]|nr:methionyl-tRNA formyltransferase [Candidatus Limnocylindrales bacterium]
MGTIGTSGKILLFGQAQFGQKVFEELVRRGHEVVAVCPPPDAAGKPDDPLKAAAVAAGVRVVQRRSYRGADAAAETGAASADLAVLAYVTQIIPSAVLDAPRFGSICFHPSLLPAYRGGSAINWQIIDGCTKSGVTLFRPDDGIDEGPILLQKELEIGCDDTAGSFYYGKVFDAGVTATVECAELVLAGKANGKAQDESLATYEPLCRSEHAHVDWARSVRQVHNLIRGCDPSPGAHSEIGERSVRLYGSKIASSRDRSAPGTVLAVTSSGVEIAAAGGSVLIAKLGVDGKKIAAIEAASALGLAPGSRFGVDRP